MYLLWCVVMEMGRMSARSVTGCIQTPPYHPGGTYPQGAARLLTEEIITSKADISSFAITLWQSQAVPYSGEYQYVLYAITVYNLHPSLLAADATDSIAGKRREKSKQCCWKDSAL